MTVVVESYLQLAGLALIATLLWNGTDFFASKAFFLIQWSTFFWTVIHLKIYLPYMFDYCKQPF